MRPVAKASLSLCLALALATPAGPASAAKPFVKQALSVPVGLSAAIKNKSGRLLRRHGPSHAEHGLEIAPAPEKQSLSDRLTERVANFTGTGKFLALQGALTAGWIAAHSALGDPEMFKLNLSISVTTMLATTIVAIAQGRAAKRERIRAAEDRARAEEDLEIDKAAAVEITQLRGETRELRSELKAMGERSAAEKQELLDQLKVIGDTLHFLKTNHHMPLTNASIHAGLRE